jgi:hypothetical protein
MSEALEKDMWSSKERESVGTAVELPVLPPLISWRVRSSMCCDLPFCFSRPTQLRHVPSRASCAMRGFVISMAFDGTEAISNARGGQHACIVVIANLADSQMRFRSTMSSYAGY